MASPRPSTIPTNTRRGRSSLFIRELSIFEINDVLKVISERLDQVDAVGQNPDVKGRTLKNLAQGVEDYDSVRVDQVVLNTDFAIKSTTFTQSDLAGGVYTFNHAIGRKEILIQVLNESDEEISPDGITRTDTENASIDISSWGDITGKTFTVIGMG